jgi:hypothetical protein
LAAAVYLGFFAGWELYWRAQGYTPMLNDSKGIFASQRERIDDDATVLVGASRIRFDIDEDVWQEATGTRPEFLAVNGAAAKEILRALAADKSFAGTVYCNVAPNFFWDGGGGSERKAADWLRTAETWSPSARIGHRVSLFLERRLAFLCQDDLSLHALAAQLPPPAKRAGARGRPPFPPLLAQVRENGRELMLPRLAEEAVRQEQVRAVWTSMLAHTEPTTGAALDAHMAQVAASVETIRARGGEVIFLRLPSTGAYREDEAERWPRTQYWDRLLRDTGARGVHFEDEAILSDFDCPEWSHLTRENAQRFTRALLKVLELNVHDNE